MLMERDGLGDQEKASALPNESLAIARELGMRPLMEHVLSRREILGAQPGFYLPKVPNRKITYP